MLTALRHLFRNEHDWARDNLSAYLDEMLEARERSRVERHLGECAECRAELEGLRHTVGLLRLVPELPLPRSFLVPLSEARPRTASQRVWGFAVMRTASVVASFLLVIALSSNLAFRAGYLGFASSSEAEVAVTREVEGVMEAEALPPTVVAEDSAREMPVAKAIRVEKEVVVEAPAAAPSQAPRVLEKEARVTGEQEVTEKAQAAKPEMLLESPGIAAMSKESPAATPEVVAVAEERAVAATDAMPAEGAAADVATAVPVAPIDATPVAQAFVEATPVPTVVVELERPSVRTMASPRDDRADARQRLGAALDGVMWALLLTTVVLWAATALSSRRRYR